MPLRALRWERRTLRVLFVPQIISGIALSVNAVGAARFAVPATAIVHRHDRRPSLAAGYLVAAAGSITAAVRGSIPLLIAGVSCASTAGRRYG